MDGSNDSLVRMVAMQGVALVSVLYALKKQPGFDVSKFTNDINQALLHHETSSEVKPAGVPSASATDYLLLRVMLSKALPDLPVQ